MTQNTIRPPAPPWLDQVRFIIYYALNPCDVPYACYLEFSRKPGTKLFFWLFTFGLDDFVKELFRPKGLPCRRHGRKGRKRPYKGELLPDPSEEYARDIRTTLSIPTAEYSFGLKMLYIFSDQYDRVTWSAALTSEVTETVFDTLWGVIEGNRDHCPNYGRFMGHGYDILVGGAGAAWKAFGYTVKDYAHGVTSTNGFNVRMGPGRFAVSCGVKITAGADGQTVGLRMLKAGTPGSIEDEMEIPGLNAGDSVDMVVSCTAFEGEDVQLEIEVLGGFANVDRMHWTALQVAI